MTYLKYLQAVLFGFSISCLIFVALVLFQLGVPTQTSRWIYELNNVKIGYARSIETPKLLLVSGSNTLYGISCQAIETEAKVPCINTALTQELGIDYILTNARAFAKAGDTILLPLEYQLYISDGTPSELSIDYIFAYSPEYLKSTDLLTKVRTIGGISFNRLSQGILAKFKPLPLNSTNNYQGRVNQNGDVTDNIKSKMTQKQYNLMASWEPFNLDRYNLKDYAKNRIIEFVNWCRKNNINLIATWPSIVQFDAYQQPGVDRFFQSIENFYQQLGVPVIGKARDFMYEKSLFFNSVYHLNDVGRQQRTKQILSLIKAYLSNRI